MAHKRSVVSDSFLRMMVFRHPVFSLIGRTLQQNCRTQFFVLLVCLLAHGNAHSQGAEQQSIKIGETDLYPSVRVDYKQNDNIFLSASDELDSTGVIISPRVDWVADRRLLTLRGNYTGNYSSNSESALDYADHEFSADAAAEFTARKRAEGKLVLEFGHETLGTQRTRGSATTDDTAVKFLSTTLSGEYVYGAKNARGNLIGGVRLQNFAYTNRSDVTSGGDYTSLEPYGIFSLRLSPDTRALLELRFASINFNGSRDRTDTSLLAGFSFEPSGKFGGDLKVGTTLSNFSGGDSDSSVISEISLFYEPVPFSRFSVNFARSIDNESANPANADAVNVITDELTVGWRHEWSSRVFHNASLSIDAIDQACPSSDLTITGGSFDLNVLVRRWLTVGANFAASQRESDDCAGSENVLDYERQIVGVHFRATL